MESSKKKFEDELQNAYLKNPVVSKETDSLKDLFTAINVVLIILVELFTSLTWYNIS